MNLKVSLQQLADYDPACVKHTLKLLLEPLGGMHAFVQPGQSVLIKPNMLAGKHPDKAVTTHPEIVRQVIMMVQAAGGKAKVGDSPGLGSPESVARKCGILAVVEETGAEFAPFVESVPIHLASGTFHQLEVARDALNADVIINLPKLKTHQMMGYTGAVKNMFGLVVGMRKARLHLQAGTDKAFFALMLLELAERFAPALSIMDAVVGMEGNGPGNGDPVALGALLASPNALALDTVATSLVSLPQQSVWTQKMAAQQARPAACCAQINLYGTPLEALQVDRFKSARSTDVNFGLPAPIKNVLKNATTAQPAISVSCRLCGECASHCPPRAMRLGRQKVEIDYNRCIRCFCCQELCPYDAVITRQGMLLRLAEFLHRR